MLEFNGLRDIITVNVNVFEGDILLSDSYVQDIAANYLKELSENRNVYSFSPESTYIDNLGFKLCTIFRLGKVKSLTVFIKSGSPHSLQIPLAVQEAAENTGFDKKKIRYWVWEKSEIIEITDVAVRKARHLNEIEDSLVFQETLDLIKNLREKCPNDAKETFESVIGHLEEELGEVKEAWKTNDFENLKEELGDLVYNIFLFALIASEKNKFNFEIILKSTINKMKKLHPKIYN